MRYVMLLCSVLVLAPYVGHAQSVTVTPHHAFDAPEAPTALAFSGDGRFLLAGDEDGRVTGWDVARQTPVFRARRSDEIAFLGFLPGDTTFVSVDRGGAVSVGRLTGADRSLDVRLQTPAQPRTVTLDAGKRYLAVAMENERIALFDLQAEMTAGQIDAREHLDGALFLGFDRLGRQLVLITRRGTVAAWNPTTQRPMRELTLGGGELHGSRSVVHAAATNRAGNVFVVGLEEVALPRGGLQGRARPGDLERRHVVIAYDWDSGVEITRVDVPDGPVRRIALGPGSDHVVVADEEHALALVDLRAGELVGTATVEERPEVLALSDDDRWLAAGTAQGRVAVWKLEGVEPPTAARADDAPPALSGRIRVLSEATPALPEDTSAQVAVLPFKGQGEAARVAEICSDALATQLAGAEHLTLLERERIDEVLDELDLQASELTEDNGARIGRLLNADYLILGSLNALGTTYLFNARLLHVETSQIVEGRQVICEECRVQDVFDAIHLLGTTMAR